MKSAGSIRQLDQRVVNRIAAGEAISCPSNAIKELIENSIDANSSRIIIDIDRGGYDLIRITDDGCGINYNDLPIACKAHTTSKISEYSDLQKISTFGFRGEALHSISMVTHLKIITMTEKDEVASVANYEEGELIGQIGFTAATKGTIIEARNLFYNYTLRLQGINPNSEAKKITDIISKYSVIYPQISFTVRCNKKETLMTYGNMSNSETVLKLLYGFDDINFFRCNFDLNNGVYVNLFLSEPNSKVKKKTNALFINGRLVKNDNLTKGIEEAYTKSGTFGLGGIGSLQFSFITMTIPPSNVDVNIHPKKEKVKFLNEKEIINEICQRLKEIVTDRTKKKPGSNSKSGSIYDAFFKTQTKNQTMKNQTILQSFSSTDTNKRANDDYTIVSQADTNDTFSTKNSMSNSTFFDSEKSNVAVFHNAARVPSITSIPSQKKIDDLNGLNEDVIDDGDNVLVASLPTVPQSLLSTSPVRSSLFAAFNQAPKETLSQMRKKDETGRKCNKTRMALSQRTDTNKFLFLSDDEIDDFDDQKYLKENRNVLQRKLPSSLTIVKDRDNVLSTKQNSLAQMEKSSLNLSQQPKSSNVLVTSSKKKIETTSLELNQSPPPSQIPIKNQKVETTSLELNQSPPPHILTPKQKNETNSLELNQSPPQTPIPKQKIETNSLNMYQSPPQSQIVNHKQKTESISLNFSKSPPKPTSPSQIPTPKQIVESSSLQPIEKSPINLIPSPHPDDSSPSKSTSLVPNKSNDESHHQADTSLFDLIGKKDREQVITDLPSFSPELQKKAIESIQKKNNSPESTSKQNKGRPRKAAGKGIRSVFDDLKYDPTNVCQGLNISSQSSQTSARNRGRQTSLSTDDSSMKRLEDLFQNVGENMKRKFRVVKLLSIISMRKKREETVDEELKLLFHSNKMKLVGFIGTKTVIFSVPSTSSLLISENEIESDDNEIVSLKREEENKNIYIFNLFALMKDLLKHKFLQLFSNLPTFNVEIGVDEITKPTTNKMNKSSISSSSSKKSIHQRFDELINDTKSSSHFFDDEEMKQSAKDCLNEKKDMLLDYFSIFYKDGMIKTMPDVIRGYRPSFQSFPLFLEKLITEVDWEDEMNCFESLIDQLSNLYSILPEDGNDENQNVANNLLLQFKSAVLPELADDEYAPNLSLRQNGSFVSMPIPPNHS